MRKDGKERDRRDRDEEKRDEGDMKVRTVRRRRSGLIGGRGRQREDEGSVERRGGVK